MSTQSLNTISTTPSTENMTCEGEDTVAQFSSELFYDDGLEPVREYLKLLQSKCDALIRNRDLTASEIEHSKNQARQNTAVSARLSALSKSLEAQHNAAMSGRTDAAHEEQERRQQLNENFQKMIGDMTIKIEEADNMRRQGMERNKELTQELQHYIELYETREKEDAISIQQEKDAQARHQESLKKIALQVDAVRGGSQMLLRKIESTCKEEEKLKLELAEYAKKFEGFQKSLLNTNERFVNYKTTMAALKKNLQQLEQKNAAYREAASTDKGRRALAKLQEEICNLDAENNALDLKKSRLQAVIAALKSQVQESERGLDSSRGK